MRRRNTIVAGTLIVLLLVVLSGFIARTGNPELVDKVFKVAVQQYTQMLAHSKDLSLYPRTTDKNGQTKYVGIGDWTGGFWAGDLWYVYECTKDQKWKEEATRWTQSLEKDQYNTTHHDLGFMMYCSYGNAYKITKNEKYKRVLIQSAKSLASRYNPHVGCIKSWNSKMSWDGKTLLTYPVIIDNMMNLELLFFASKATGNPIFKNIAVKHAENTMKNQVRPDYSCYHVVNYDSATGRVLNRETNQGFSDNSAWARGQAWGIYGFTMVYRETHDEKFLNTAKRMADFYIDNPHLPKDKIPYWDFNVNQPGYAPQWNYDKRRFPDIPRDASAAAVTCAALFELSGYLGKEGKKYYDFAVATLNTLASPAYMAAPGTNGNFILMHSVGSIPHNVEVDVPLVYADYYFLEALLRYQHQLNALNNN
ncbi:MAG: glycoside hydrolase family 88 protein [Niabella sp.]|nr:glycoside hydrolase family 88 protein [Niabella sp.]